MNFFRYLFQADEWRPNGLTARPGCTATDVKLLQLLRALEAENFSLPGATIREVLRILERQVDNFDRRDSDIYAMVIDPANQTVAAVQARVNNESCAMMAVVRDDVNTSITIRPNQPRRRYHRRKIVVHRP